MDACSECGLEYDEVPVDEVDARLASLGPNYRDRLVSGDPPVARGGLRNRPDLDVWTPLEYACHLRDLLEVQRARLALALSEECPTFAPMGREELVITRRYDEQDPVAVADQIDRRTEELADRVRRPRRCAVGADRDLQLAGPCRAVDGLDGPPYHP